MLPARCLVLHLAKWKKREAARTRQGISEPSAVELKIAINCRSVNKAIGRLTRSQSAYSYEHFKLPPALKLMKEGGEGESSACSV